MRLIGRAEWGGRDSAQLARALDEIHYTFVRTRFKSSGKFVEHSFNIFPEILLERREHATDPIEACTVTLARPIMASLQDGHFTCLNHGLMQQLGTIGQALYMRLFFHFANLYDGHHQKRLTFVKRYDDICVEWLGGLALRPYQSVIERDQLGPHLRQLVKSNFLASYVISDAKGRGGFVISFRPGSAFFADYDRFYRHREQGSVQFDFHADRQQIADPLKVAYLFVEKRTGGRSAGIPYVPSKDVETAKYLLARLSFEDMPDFLDYALAEAKKTNFDVQTLGGLKQYLSRYQENRTARAASKKIQARRQAEEEATQRRMDYDRFRRAEADRLFAKLPSKEQAAIEATARAKAPRYARGTGSLAQTMFEIERARITAERYPGKIPPLDQWQQRAA